MKKILTLIAILSITLVQSQISDGGLPMSFDLNKQQTPISNKYQIVEIEAPTAAIINLQDKSAEEKNKPYRVAVNISTQLNILNSGSWTTLMSGDKVWRLGIKVQDAKALGVYLNQDLEIPKGGKLHLYNDNHSQYIGAFTSNSDGFTAFEMIQGDKLTLEYYMPKDNQSLPNISISEIAYYYRGVGERMVLFENGRASDNRADACQVDVACSEIAGWEPQRDAVVKYTFVLGTGTFLCSGAVINNTEQDCKPYILTANHCGEPTSSTDIEDHLWYFNYQRPTCSQGNTTPYNGAQSQTMSGGYFRASSELGTHPPSNQNQVAGCDFVLLELEDSIPSAYNAFYSGWNRNNGASGSGVGIHHPNGDEKKISTYSTSVSSSTYNGGWSGAHWLVNWVSTTHGHGVTEGGSSGSPLFNTDGKIVGHLSGGSSYCNAPTLPDLYGKFNKAWTQDGNNSSSQLKPWLDPLNSGVLELDGAYTPCSSNTGYCDATSVTCDEYISNVTLAGVSKTSSCDHYSHYWQNQPIELSASSFYQLNITPAILNSSSVAYDGDQIAAWIDWNSDGDFTDAGELVLSEVIVGSPNIPLNTVILVPSNAELGTTRMRVRITFDVTSEGPISPCGTSNYGEVEDYQLNINEGALSINTSDLGLVKIFPNPTSGELNINLNKYLNVDYIMITDVSGKIITNHIPTAQNTKLDLNQYTKGMYFVVIKSVDHTWVKKVILE
ncbi:MAG: GEVED domain-containing protein [Crocinitomicaceae bacterium]